MRDFFRPRSDPARLLYDAFEAEAGHRKRRTVAEWRSAEALKVWQAARDYATENGLTVPTPEQVERASDLASGHVDYGAKWAYGVSRLIKGSNE